MPSLHHFTRANVMKTNTMTQEDGTGNLGVKTEEFPVIVYYIARLHPEQLFYITLYRCHSIIMQVHVHVVTPLHGNHIFLAPAFFTYMFMNHMSLLYAAYFN